MGIGATIALCSHISLSPSPRNHDPAPSGWKLRHLYRAGTWRYWRQELSFMQVWADLLVYLLHTRHFIFRRLDWQQMKYINFEAILAAVPRDSRRAGGEALYDLNRHIVGETQLSVARKVHRRSGSRELIWFVCFILRPATKCLTGPSDGGTEYAELTIDSSLSSSLCTRD